MTETLTLIEGLFSPAEAADVLLSLINDKIKFHTVKSLQLHKGEIHTKESSEARLQELREIKGKVEELVVEAHKSGVRLEIKSAIKIQFVDD